MKRQGPRHEDRNRRICAQYAAGATFDELCKAFALRRQRVVQILTRAGVYTRPASTRKEFLGVLVNDTVKCGLKQIADERTRASGGGGKVSASQVANELLEQALRPADQEDK